MFDILIGVALGLFFFCAMVQPSGTIPAKHWWQSKYDATDDAVNDVHSGMQLYIDHGTGCHYLAPSVFSGLTPRLGRDGKHICEEPKA